MKYLLDTNVYLEAFRSDERKSQFRQAFFPLLPATFLASVVAYELNVNAKNAHTRTLLQELIGPMERTGRFVSPTFVEGAGRHTKKEFVNYLHMAQGSLSELDTQSEIAKRIGYLNESSWSIIDAQMERIDKMLTGLIRHQSPNA